MSTMQRIVFALFDGCEILDVAGPLQAFHEATLFGAPYEIMNVAASPRVRTSQGLTFDGVAPLPDDLGPNDRVIVPGYTLADTTPPATLVRFVRRAAASGARVCSVCTGSFVLGDAGLLDGRRCTTHWKRVREMQRRFPRAQVVGERLFVEDGPIASSAGIAAGIDMALAFLERDGGPVLASQVAREMVVYLRRDGSHAQESVYLDYQTHLSPGVHVVQQHLVSHPDSPATLGTLAKMAGMSERHLTRTFKRATGISVHAYRESLRLERARDLMRNPTLTLDAIASQCGYADGRQLRRAWSARYGEAPSASRMQGLSA